MDQIGIFILENIDKFTDDELQAGEIQNGIQIGMNLDEMCEILFNVIDVQKVVDLNLFENNLGISRKTIISFVYDGRKCEIAENFGSQRDYFCVKMFPV
jgi:hypothetical protein